MLKKMCEMLDEHCEKNNKKMVMCLIETDEEGNAQNLVLHRIANPLPGIGMIEMLVEILETEKQDLKELVLSKGDKTDSRETIPEILGLMKRFEDLKAEGEKVKADNPAKLLDILTEIKDIVDKIKSLDPRKKDSEKKNDSGDSMDDFKNMF
jgi:hypothetical protein